MGDDLREGQGCGFDVVPALDDLEVWRDGAEIVVGVFVGEVAQAECLADLAWREELLELCSGEGLASWRKVTACIARRMLLYWTRKNILWLGCRARDRECACPR